MFLLKHALSNGVKQRLMEVITHRKRNQRFHRLLLIFTMVCRSDDRHPSPFYCAIAGY
ncbi:Uncharacterised protein [Vibrio cholerae]|nr:Uncharacterised protein [Vibrio cholerae]